MREEEAVLLHLRASATREALRISSESAIGYILVPRSVLALVCGRRTLLFVGYAVSLCKWYKRKRQPMAVRSVLASTVSHESKFVVMRKPRGDKSDRVAKA